VDVEAAFVCLVDDQHLVLAQHAVARDLGQQDAVGHDLHERLVARGVGEPHLVSDGTAQFAADLGRDALGDRARGDTPRLRVPDLPPNAQSEVEADLRQLRRLARPGLAGDDHDLVVADRLGEVLGTSADRQLFGIRDARYRGPAPAHPLLARVDVGGDLGGDLLGLRRGGTARLACTVDPAAHTVGVAQGQSGQARAQLIEGGTCRHTAHQRTGRAAIDRRDYRLARRAPSWRGRRPLGCAWPYRLS